MRAVVLSPVVVLLGSAAFAAAPQLPSGPHPRLFMSAQEIAGYTANGQNAQSRAAAQVAACQDTMGGGGGGGGGSGGDGGMIVGGGPGGNNLTGGNQNGSVPVLAFAALLWLRRRASRRE